MYFTAVRIVHDYHRRPRHINWRANLSQTLQKKAEIGQSAHKEQEETTEQKDNERTKTRQGTRQRMTVKVPNKQQR